MTSKKEFQPLEHSSCHDYKMNNKALICFTMQGILKGNSCIPNPSFFPSWSTVDTEDATPVAYMFYWHNTTVIKDKHGFIPPRKPSKALSRRPSGLKLAPLSQTIRVHVWSGAAVASFSLSKAPLLPCI